MEEPLTPSYLERIPEQVRLQDQVYLIIKQAILDLKLEPGQPISEGELVRQLKVSRTPVRDALLRLEREGLVVIRPFRGTYVAEISMEDAAEIFQLRELIETAAAAAAARRMHPTDLAWGKSLLRQMEEAREAGNDRQFLELAEEFHNMIVEQLRNRRITAVMDNLYDHQRRIRKKIMASPGIMPEALSDYTEILSAVEARDEGRASEAMRRHLLHVWRRLTGLDYYQSFLEEAGDEV
jgi:DNA-binding GntR family transcriptional regulator